MTAWAQYLTYLIAGALYYLLLAAFFSVAAGFSVWAIVLVLLALIIGGYASGLSFFAPRLAAAIGGVVAVLFLLWTVGLAFSEADGPVYGVAALPALAALVVSVIVVRKRPDAAWAQHRSAGWRITAGVLSGIPAALATWVIVVFMSRLIL